MGELGVEIVLECSGRFRTPELLDGYFSQGVRKVIVAAPVKEDALNVVVGVNDHLSDPQRHRILTAASCTTNCLAPGEGHPRGDRHPPRADHDLARHDEHPDTDRRATQGLAQGTCHKRLADPVVVGISETFAARALRKSLCGASIVSGCSSCRARS